MTSRRHHEAGDTLVEILIAIVLIGIVASGSFFAISVGATTSKSQHDYVLADTVLRNYAEAAKQAVRNLPCTSANAGTAFTPVYTPPTGFTVTAPVSNLKCPPVTSWSEVDITATLPDGTKKLLNVDVRTP
jgi:prepilin-type N-terminal cleavage/methylation domain-containing protein